MEIAEEGEEEEQREAKRQSVVAENDQPGEIGDAPARPRSPITGPPVTLDSTLATSPKDSKYADTAEPPSFTGVERPASPTKSFDDDIEPRVSTQSSRHDYYSSPSHMHSKPRVRLGPRPSNDSAGRPRSSAGDAVRPVASMPAGLKLALKGAKKTKTQDDSSSIISEAPSDHTFLAPTTSIPEHSNLRPHTSEGGRPTTSSGISVRSMSAITQPAKQVMTTEKLRLMKALQLREKKKRATAVSEPRVPSVQVTPSPAVEPGDEKPGTVPKKDTEVAQETMAQAPDNDSGFAADQISVSKADSAIDVASTAPTDHTSEHTQTDSRPPSPNCASSEVDESTQASSVSESTDETVHPPGEKVEYAENDSNAAETRQTSDEQAVEVSASPGDVESGPGVEGQETDPAGLTRGDHQPGEQDAEAPRREEEEEKAKSAQEVSPSSEHSFVPKSKFAANLPSGQAAMDPLESRGQDPPNVTSGPGRIDEADPGPVDPPERTEDGTSTTSSKWNLPISKYSTHDSSKSLAPSTIPAIVTSPAESQSGQDRSTNESDNMVDDGATTENKRSGRPEPILTGSDLPEKQPAQDNEKVAPEPQSTTNDNEDANSAMIHSPVTETPPQPSAPPTPRVLRTVSSPVSSPHSVAGDAPPHSARSISSGSLAFQRGAAQQSSSTHLAPRQSAKLGAGLASRIKAFEQLATKAPPPSVPVSTGTGRPSSAFFSIRQSSVRDGARSPSVLERTNSIYRGKMPAPGESQDSSPEVVMRPSRDRSGSVASRMSVFEGGMAPMGRPETIQVTAKIVREPGQNYPRPPGSQVDPTDYAPLDLQQSPLIVDHRKSVDLSGLGPATNAPPVPTPLVHAGEPRKSLQERRLSKDLKNSANEDMRDGLHRPGQRTSLTMARDFIRDSMVGKDSSAPARPPSVHQSGSLLSRLSINTRRKSISQDPALLSPTATELSESGDERKEGNRASRLMRRLSSTFSPGRKQSSTMTSPTVNEDSEAEKGLPAQSMTAPATAGLSSIVAHMGDVNVQFPENLLWKRRAMYLDSNGFLLLTPAQGAVSAREKQLKRFHMSEFKSPYAPEIEFQELPNSVCLDLKSGSGLQIAFTDRAGQLNGLQSESTSVSCDEDQLLTTPKQFFKTRMRSTFHSANKSLVYTD